MSRTNAVACLLVLAGMAQSASAQITFQLQRTEEFFALRQDGLPQTPPLTGFDPNPFFVNSPGSIAAGPTSATWYVGGIDIGGTKLNQSWDTAAVRVGFANTQGTTPTVGARRSFATMPDSRVPAGTTPIGSGRGTNNVAYDTINNRVLVTSDLGGGFGKLAIFDGSLSPSLGLIPSLSTAETTRRVMGGGAWDFGPDRANGNPGLSTLVRDALPLVAALDNGEAGPRGVQRSTLDNAGEYDAVNNPGGFLYLYAPASLTTNAPKFFPNSPDYGANGEGLAISTTNSLHRDIDIDADSGLMVSRSNNSLIAAVRQADNRVPTANITRISIPNGLFINQVCQNVKIMKGTPLGDLVILNNRPTTPAGPNTFTSTQIRQVTAPGSANPFPLVTTTWKRPDGSTVASLTDNIQLMDYAWLPGEQRLLLLDTGGNGTVFVFDLITSAADITTPPANVCVEAGASTTLTVATSGQGVNFQWALNTVDILGATSASYTIASASALNTGTYTVRAFNALNGTPASGSAVVTLGPCGGPTFPARCNPVDIAYDTGDPLPRPAIAGAGGTPEIPGDFGGVNNGVTEGDYNLFFANFFDAGIVCDIANDDGAPLPPFGTLTTNNGVTEADYNLFFSIFFDGCSF